ncbi:MAG: hypothetical protein RLZZ519_713 [Bacteroidota bacterium]
MKYCLPGLLFAFCFVFSIRLAAQPSTFSIQLGDSSDYMYLADFTQVNPSTYWLLGLRRDTTFLASFDQHGQLHWAQELPNEIVWKQLVPRPNGDAYAVGTHELPNYTLQLAVGYFDSNGTNQWTMLLDTANRHFRGNSSLLSNGNLIVTGTKASSAIATSGYVAVIAPNGNIVWEHTFARGLECSAIGFGSNEAYVTLCDTFTYTDLIRFDSAGNVRWAKRLDNCQATGLTLQGDSLLYVASNAWSVSLSASIAVLDTAGNFRWARDFMGTQGTQSITFLNNNRLLLSGTIFVPDFMDPHSEGSMAIYDFNTNTYAPNGNHRWYHGARSNLYVTQDGGYITASVEHSSTTDLYLEKFDTSLLATCRQPLQWFGNVAQFTVTPVPITVTPTPATAHANYGAIVGVAYNLPLWVDCSTVGISDPPKAQLTVWPNPSTDRVQVEWPRDAFGTSEVHIELWSSDGRLVIAQMIENTGTATRSLESIPAGTYFLRLRNADFALGQMVIKD